MSEFSTDIWMAFDVPLIRPGGLFSDVNPLKDEKGTEERHRKA